MKKYAWIVLIGFVLIIISSCVIAKPTYAPPPLRKDIRPHKPGPNSVWILGHWKWSGGKYFWIPGYWTKPRPGKIWVPGHWKKVGPHWVWKPGHWR